MKTTHNDTDKEFLVEIRVKAWIALPDGQSRAIAYEEVIASNEIAARMKGIDQFRDRAKYAPITRRKMEQLGLDVNRDTCAPDAVEL